MWLHAVISLGLRAGGFEAGVAAVEKRKLLLLPGMACQFLVKHPMAQTYYWWPSQLQKTMGIFQSFCSEMNEWCEMRRASIASNF